MIFPLLSWRSRWSTYLLFSSVEINVNQWLSSKQPENIQQAAIISLTRITSPERLWQYGGNCWPKDLQINMPNGWSDSNFAFPAKSIPHLHWPFSEAWQRKLITQLMCKQLYVMIFVCVSIIGCNRIDRRGSISDRSSFNFAFLELLRGKERFWWRRC